MDGTHKDELLRSREAGWHRFIQIAGACTAAVAVILLLLALFLL